MSGSRLPDEDNVVRYVKPNNIDVSGKASPAAFRLRRARPDDVGLSVNWMGYHRDFDKIGQLSEIRRVSRLSASGFNDLAIGSGGFGIRRFKTECGERASRHLEAHR